MEHVCNCCPLCWLLFPPDHDKTLHVQRLCTRLEPVTKHKLAERWLRLAFNRVLASQCQNGHNYSHNYVVVACQLSLGGSWQSKCALWGSTVFSVVNLDISFHVGLSSNKSVLPHLQPLRYDPERDVSRISKRSAKTSVPLKQLDTYKSNLD